MSHAIPGLPVAANQTRYPVLIYSHCFGGHRRQNTAQAEELASHGYVVVGLDHTDAFASVFPSGQVVWGPELTSLGLSYLRPFFDNRIKDVLFVMDELSRLNTIDALLAGRLDLERLGAFGKSIGAATAGEVCRLDARCKASVLLDAGFTLEVPSDLIRLGLQMPFLSMSSTMGRPPIPPDYNPDWLFSSQALFAKATNHAFWCQIRDSTHASFDDRGSLMMDPTLTGGPTAASRAQALAIRACLLSFFDKYLKDQDDHLLDNPAAVHPNIINFQSK